MIHNRRLFLLLFCFLILRVSYLIALTPSENQNGRFSEQWSLHNIGQVRGKEDADIDDPEAWNITTGRDDVVIAIIDYGVDYLHSDLKNKIWINPGEIPDNDRDDDGNGYYDDVRGWDFVNCSDDFKHGGGVHIIGMAMEPV